MTRQMADELIFDIILMLICRASFRVHEAIAEGLHKYAYPGSMRIFKLEVFWTWPLVLVSITVLFKIGTIAKDFTACKFVLLNCFDIYFRHSGMFRINTFFERVRYNWKYQLKKKYVYVSSIYMYKFCNFYNCGFISSNENLLQKC